MNRLVLAILLILLINMTHCNVLSVSHNCTTSTLSLQSNDTSYPKTYEAQWILTVTTEAASDTYNIIIPSITLMDGSNQCTLEHRLDSLDWFSIQSSYARNNGSGTVRDYVIDFRLVVNHLAGQEAGSYNISNVTIQVNDT